METETQEKFRRLLLDLQNRIREHVLAGRDASSNEGLRDVVARTSADTIYRIDRFGEEAILDWFENHWPADEPVELVMEGLEDDGPTVFPAGVSETKWKCIIDPIDGTRNLMHDKRAAWALTALAPQKGADNRLLDIEVAVMTELPPRKQRWSDQISAVRGGGRDRLNAVSLNLDTGATRAVLLEPSQANDFLGGFASISRFFPEGKTWLAALEEKFWRAQFEFDGDQGPLVFEDQFICTGGQFYELLSGHDRMLGDLRPLAHEKLGLQSALVCHPYDVCTALILQEGGGIVEDPWGKPLNPPLDTTSPVVWIAYANSKLAALSRPIWKKLLKEEGL